MEGVDATKKVVEQGIRRCEQEGLSDRIEFTLPMFGNSGLADASEALSGRGCMVLRRR